MDIKKDCIFFIYISELFLALFNSLSPFKFVGLLCMKNLFNKMIKKDLVIRTKKAQSLGFEVIHSTSIKYSQNYHIFGSKSILTRHLWSQRK
ncbi:hypothetical protein BpHYR1_015258 [Brachionus plicatilis]|uniref:Uncharacterized protein n=1 Tax=Brachionus plicatilis TaxID=10195 RepID=A0A3M7Q2Z5_BRAPC|nr:hypothetical protein BpHYR1_015258 [Brachionus plicatilis]